MNRRIKKVVVLGSGIMGSRIACHFSNINVEVLLLDIAEKNHSPREGEVAPSRNKIVDTSLLSAIQSNPSPLFDRTRLHLIQTGNFEDDLSKINEADWIIEAVVENPEIKKSLFDEVEKYRRQGTLITSNTSGISIQLMMGGRSEDFQQHFCGTHFFNPPRYLRLLEIIPTSKTKKEVIEFLMHYGDLYLGKETVLCKDTPAFIANRVGVYAIMSIIHAIEQTPFYVSEIDKLTGTVIGHAKSATFRTLDIVGLDTFINVSNNLYETLSHDESRRIFRVPKIIQQLAEKKWLGEKTRQGFYKKAKRGDKKEILELNFKTLAYESKKKVNFDALNKVKDIENLRERLPLLLSDTGKVGDFYRRIFYDLFSYCSFRIPEISDELYKIDQAVARGFGWELGPFESWDALDLKSTVESMKKEGFAPADWVQEMIKEGHSSFYLFKNGQKYYYDIASKSYRPIAGTEGIIYLNGFKSNIVWENPGVTIYDLGDNVLNIEFHTKMNVLDGDVLEGINHAINLAEKNHRGIVIGNEGIDFSAGANLSLIFMNAVDQEFDEIHLIVKTFQDTVSRIRFSKIPVVIATSGLTLGGGCEITLHSDAVQAHAETYIGLVEMGVGLIPAGGGTKELVLRASDEYKNGDPELNTLQEYFMNIATAKVTTSATEAFDMNMLRGRDSITLNRKRLLTEAKQKVLSLSKTGYTPPSMRKDIKVHGKSALAMFKAGIEGMRYGNYISKHDAKIGNKLAWVMVGGDLSSPASVSEEYLLELEREAFLSLCGEKKTLERIQSILFKGKPLRN